MQKDNVVDWNQYSLDTKEESDKNNDENRTTDN